MHPQHPQDKISRSRYWTYLLLPASLLLILIIGFNRINGNPRSVIWSDAEGYYKYLPGVFILHDVHKMDAGSIWPQYNEQGEYVDKYTCGVAYFQLPFFLVSHLLNMSREHPDKADYYNNYYAKGAAVSGMFYGWLGLVLLFFFIRKRFSVSIASWVVLSVFFGTNLFHYTTREMGMVHVYSFFLFVSMMCYFPIYLKRPGILQSIVMGSIMGCMFIIRPTNAIAFLWLLGYEVYSFEALKERCKTIFSSPRNIGIIAVTAFIMVFPQLWYWKEMTGHWIYYSYSEEGFIFWKNPKLASVLFDVQNGLFLYSPLVLLMVLGTLIGAYRKQWSGPALAVIFILATYSFASWWAWWFGGAFGHRCYVDYYALLALPLAGLYQSIWNHKSAVLRYAFVGLTLALMYYSVRLSYLYNAIGGPWDGTDWRWNWDKYAWIMHHFF